MSNDAKKVGVFIDYDNIHISLEQDGKMISLEKYDIFREIGLQYGRVTMIKPFAIWDNLYLQEKAFAEVGITPVPVILKLKNATDIALVTNLLDAVYAKGIDVVVLFTGDGGYAPVVYHIIQELDRDVYVYSVSTGAHQKVYQPLKDKHILFDVEYDSSIVPLIAMEAEHAEAVRYLRSFRKLDYVTQGYYVKKLSEDHPIFSTKGKPYCSTLLDNLLSLKYCEQDYVADPVKGGQTRIVKINFAHPHVMALGLK